MEKKKVINSLLTHLVFLLSADLSSYVPKHSVDFSAWQEHKHDDGVYQEDTTSQQTQMTEEVMVRGNSSVHQKAAQFSDLESRTRSRLLSARSQFKFPVVTLWSLHPLSLCVRTRGEKQITITDCGLFLFKCAVLGFEIIL